MIAAGALIVIDTLTSPRSMPCEQRLHVVQRVDRDALAPDLAQRARMVGVVAHQRRHVERGAQPGLPVVEQVAEALVGLLRRPEPRELPHRPQPAPVHARVHAARERKLAREPDPLRRAAGPASVYSARIGSPESVVKRRRALRRRGIALRPGLEILSLVRDRHRHDSNRSQVRSPPRAPTQPARACGLTAMSLHARLK